MYFSCWRAGSYSASYFIIKLDCNILLFFLVEMLMSKCENELGPFKMFHMNINEEFSVFIALSILCITFMNKSFSRLVAHPKSDHFLVRSLRC